MQASDIPKFTAMMAGIGELYGKTISSMLTEIYWKALQHFEMKDVQQAFEVHINNPDCGQFFPKPADVVRFIEGSGETKALQAWAKVYRAIIHVGSYQSIAYDDPIIHAVLEDMGGWIKLCSVKNDQMPFCANEFQKRYMGFVNNKPKRHPKYFCGIAEIENARNGHEVEPPLLLGDLKKAEEVIVSGGGTPLLVHNQSQYFNQIILKISQSRGGNGEE